MKGPLLVVAGVVAILTVVASAFYWKDLKRMPEIGAGFYAKELCSCIFVTQQTESYCRELVRQYIPASRLEIDRENKVVTAEVLGSERFAVMTEEKFGCVLNRD